MNAENLLILLKSKICKKFLEEIEKQCHILYSLHDDDFFLFFDNFLASELNAKTARLIKNAQIVQDLQKINIKDFFNIKSTRATFNQF